ncbi:MAG: hypothetical protein WDN72_01445 [Alphaproteobacteria bacterium]
MVFDTALAQTVDQERFARLGVGGTLSVLGVVGPQSGTSEAQPRGVQNDHAVALAMLKAEQVERALAQAARSNPAAAQGLNTQITNVRNLGAAGDVKAVQQMMDALPSIIQAAIAATNGLAGMTVAEQQQAQMNAIMGQWRDTNEKIHKDLDVLDPYLTDEEKKERQLLEAKVKDPNLTPSQRAQAMHDLADYDKKTSKDLETRIPPGDKRAHDADRDYEHQADREGGEARRAQAIAGNSMFSDAPSAGALTPAHPTEAHSATDRDMHATPASGSTQLADAGARRGAKPTVAAHPAPAHPATPDKTKDDAKTATTAPGLTVSMSGFEVAAVDTHGGPGTTPAQPPAPKVAGRGTA